VSTDSTPTRVAELACNLDDMTGEALGSMIDLLLKAGALDAWFVPIYMKQNRPGVTLSVLCAVEDTQRLCDLLLEHTTTLGVRWSVMERNIAQREQITVTTQWGPVRCKVKRLPTKPPRPKPEYHDCLALARANGLPWQTVHDASLRAALEALTRSEE
jgi:pyridinium-3,5-bisthiocarboxylic acid mononucleotide nickel chelatase